MPDLDESARQPLAIPPDSSDSKRPWPGLDRLGLIPLLSTSDHITRVGTSLPLQQQWGPFSSLPRWRQWLSMLNWRPVREIEQRTKQIEQRTRELEIEIAQLRAENARSRALNASIQRLCFPPESGSL
ncbi:MAG: hypothetical protein ACK55D_07405 [Synechococcaceae cyanobacterium]